MAEQENRPTTSAGEQTSIPKHRLAEEVQKRLRAEAELSALKQVLNRTMAPKTETPQALPPEMEALKERDPGLFNYLRNLELRNKETNAMLFDQQDRQDRMQFLGLRKKDGERWLPEVEKVLEQQRRAGNMFTRDQIYHFLKGAESVMKEEEAPKVQTAPVKDADAPPAQVLPQASTSAAGTSGKALTLEEMENRLSNIEF